MPTVYFHTLDDTDVLSLQLNDNESLLDGILRSGIDVPFGCKSGVCQSCLMQSNDNIPQTAQLGLRQTQIEQGFFMSCCCLPEDGFRAHMTKPKSDFVTAKVLEKELLNQDIYRIRVEKVVDYRPGQFATLWSSNGVARSYSFASHPQEDDFIEFHIKKIENGAFSQWAWNNLEQSHTLEIQGPLGDCFYTESDMNQTLLMCGIGTGLAPLYGILRDALISGHKGKITLYLGGRNSTNLYFMDNLKTLAEKFNNFSFECFVQEVVLDNQSANLKQGDIYQEVKRAYPNLEDTKVFLCGADSFVKKMKKQCFLSGASMKDISSDAFIAFKKD